MTDQDADGSHIKGLLINFFHHFWPCLIKKCPDFLKEFVTPIIKVTHNKTKDQTSFFTLSEFKKWEEAQQSNASRYSIKYYKGLGTSTAKEAKQYFSHLQQHKIMFSYKGVEDDKAIELAFKKTEIDARKDWLGRGKSDVFVDHSKKFLTYSDFVNKELIHFSRADCFRSIPSLVDGFKPGQRKIIFSCFKRNLRAEIKVAQLAGYVAEHSSYHHGEVSLQQTIVQMAQDYVGSNNINLLEPIGQFGTRAQGGKEAASARYIYTNLT
jgi:DNA topoisomerase-2